MRRSLLITCVVLAVASVAAADIVFDGGTPNYINGNEMTSWIQANNFAFSNNTTVTGAGVWVAQVPQSFNGTLYWTIYDNLGGAPGAILFTGTASPAITDTGNNLGAGGRPDLEVYLYTFPLTFSLGAGDYWLALHNGPYDNTNRAEFYWASTDTINSAFGSEYYLPDPAGWNSNGQYHAFYLEGTTVPEPGTLVLLGSGLLAIARKVRKA